MPRNDNHTGSLTSPFIMYALVQLAQWVSYTAIFKILLDGTSHTAFRAPLYIACLALMRGIASFGWGRRKFFEKPLTYKSILAGGIVLTVFQVFLAKLSWINLFLIITGMKLGALTLFQVWRDVLANKISVLGIDKGNRINSRTSTIDFAAMSAGIAIGGGLTSTAGPINMLWVDIFLFALPLFLLLFAGNKIFPTVINRNLVQKTSTGWRPLGLAGHAVRSVSDAGFQGLLPVFAYQIIQMSPAVFGVVVALSALAIAIGAKSADLVLNIASICLRRYAFWGIFANFGNAAALWFCFNSGTIFWFAFWLGLASFLSGLALVVTRTVVISKSNLSVGNSHFNSSFYFNAIRWFGIAFGAVVLTWGMTVFPIYPLVAFFLLGMGVSGLLIWLEAVENEMKAHNIGKRFHGLTLGSMTLLLIVAAISSYIVFLDKPHTERLKTRILSLQPYITMVGMSMKISDLSEVMHLTRTYEYPAGVIRTTIQSQNGGRVVFEEVFSDVKNNALSRQVPSKTFFSGNHQISAYDFGFLSRFYEFKYTMPGMGPESEDIAISVIVDDTAFMREDLKRFMTAIALMLFFIGLSYLCLKRVVFQLLQPLEKVSNRLQILIHENNLTEKINPISESLAGQSLEIQKVVQGYNKLIFMLKDTFGKLAKAELDQKLGKIATQVAHDIRSPLSSLQAGVGYLRGMRMEDPKGPEALNLLELSARRLTGIADDLLKKHKGERDEKTAFSLHQVLDELVGEYEGREEYAGVRFVKQYCSSAIQLRGSPAKLQRAFGNIIKNAVEAMKGRGQMTLTTARPDGLANIEIADTGPGIPADKLELILQGGFTEGKEDGHGIGMKVVQETIAEFVGELKAESHPGRGTTFQITLPIHTCEESFTLEVGERGKPVLVVDDDAGLREQWRLVLRDQGLESLLCASYEEVEQQGIGGNLVQTAVVDYHFENSERDGADIARYLQSRGIQNITLCTAEYWKPSVQELARGLNVKLCPKPLPKIMFQNTPTRPSPIEGEGKKGYRVLVIDDDEGIRMTWKVMRERLGIGDLHLFSSLEALQREEMELSGVDIAFVDKNIEGSRYSGADVITFLKSGGVERVVLASGEDEGDLRKDPQFALADYISREKVPQSMEGFL